MTKQPPVSHDELRRIPLFRGLDDAQLDKVLALCQPTAIQGGVLFEEQTPADGFYLLTSGSVSLMQRGKEVHKLHPIAVIGEMGALTGRARTVQALVGEGYEIWKISATALRELFAAEKELGFHFYENLLDVATDKIHRDQVRLQDMRKNIIQTQKDMKRMREFLLESDDTQVSGQIHQVLEQNIARNRRVNYRVEPPSALASTLRLDTGDDTTVVQISRTHLTITGRAGDVGDRVSGVLSLSGSDIPVTGRVFALLDGNTEVELDFLFDEYEAELEGYLTRIQMLDFMV
jgi:CRP/FNR family transcriptional regulator, cyclic AMP receptor protein